MLQPLTGFYQQVVGGDVSIEVSILANPLASGFWTFDGSVLDDSDPKYNISTESFPETFQTNFLLDITNLQINDRGEYQLTASNGFGTASNPFGSIVATVFVDVQCKCVVVQPHVFVGIDRLRSQINRL